MQEPLQPGSPALYGYSSAKRRALTVDEERVFGAACFEPSEKMMSKAKLKEKTVVIQARIQPDLKDDVDQIFEQIGISRSEAIKVFLQQVRLYNGFPFDLRVPNEELKQTFKDTDAGKNRRKFKSPQALFDDLDL